MSITNDTMSITDHTHHNNHTTTITTNTPHSTQYTQALLRRLRLHRSAQLQPTEERKHDHDEARRSQNDVLHLPSLALPSPTTNELVIRRYCASCRIGSVPTDVDMPRYAHNAPPRLRRAPAPRPCSTRTRTSHAPSPGIPTGVASPWRSSRTSRPCPSPLQRTPTQPAPQSRWGTPRQSQIPPRATGR